RRQVHYRAVIVGDGAGGPAVDLGGTVGTGGGGHGPAAGACLADCQGEGAGRGGGVVDQHRDGASVPIICRRHIRLAIAIEVVHGDEDRTAAGAEVLRRLEGPIAVADQHRNGGGPIVGHRQVRFAVAIEVARGHGPR